jgi:DNA recombination protein RmuC
VGELVERVLEKIRSRKGREYEVQQSFTEEGNRVFPDVVISCLMVKMIVDSKVSLTAYEKYINEEDDDLKIGYLKSTSIQSNVM